MELYKQIFSLTVEHQFFSDSACKHLEILPGEDCTALLDKAGLVLRPTSNGINVLCETSKYERFCAHVAQQGGALKLGFKITSRDRHFAQYTLAATGSNQDVFYFDNSEPCSDDKGQQMLHAKRYATESNLQKRDAAPVVHVLGAKKVFINLCAIVHITITGGEHGLCGADLDPGLRNFGVRFATRQTYWKYYFLGQLGKKDIYVADLNNLVKFNDLGTLELPGKQLAKILISDVPMPLQETPEQRFQLRESAQLSEKILMARMPNAFVARINRAVVGGSNVLVSEIYINQ